MRRTCITVTEEDYKFARQRNLKFSHLARERLGQIKGDVTSEMTDNLRATNRKVRTFQKIIEEMRDFIEDKKLMSEFIDTKKSEKLI